MRGWLWTLIVVGVMATAMPAHAQFRNQGIQLPNIGWLGLGSTWDGAVNGGAGHDKGWNIYDQPTIGASYFFAIGYDLWVDNEVALGFSTLILDEGSGNNTPAITVAASTGIRYNLLSERLRPFIGAHIQYLQLVGFPAADVKLDIPFNTVLQNAPFFVGLRPDAGIEWIFGDEMSVMLEVGVMGFLAFDRLRSLGGLFLPASMARVSYMIYF
jgi:hypothetical protein